MDIYVVRMVGVSGYENSWLAIQCVGYIFMIRSLDNWTRFAFVYVSKCMLQTSGTMASLLI